MKVSYKLLIASLATTMVACGGSGDEAREAPQTELSVELDSAGIVETDNNLGYSIELDEVRIAIEDLEFTVAGETHASLFEKFSDFIFSPAYAHPGHNEGGEITGELLGSFIADWFDTGDSSLGTGKLLSGDYTAVNFYLGRGSEDAGLEASDPLIGHTAIISGVATLSDETVEFTIVVDSADGRYIVGVPFEAEIDRNSQGTIGFGFDIQNPINDELDTIFDDMDFLALDADEDGILLLEPPAEDAAVDDAVRAYNIFKNKLEKHDHFILTYSED